MDRPSAIRDAGRIERLHTLPHVLPYTVGHHSWAMLVLLHELFPKDPGPSRRLMWAILFHDVVERWIGDVPTTAKWSSKELTAALDKLEKEINDELDFKFKLNDNEKNWLKALDLLELFLHCEDELAAGNQHLRQVRTNCYTILTKRPAVPKEVRDYGKNFIWKREDNIWRKK